MVKELPLLVINKKRHGGAILYPVTPTKDLSPSPSPSCGSLQVLSLIQQRQSSPEKWAISHYKCWKSSNLFKQ